MKLDKVHTVVSKQFASFLFAVDDSNYSFGLVSSFLEQLASKEIILTVFMTFFYSESTPRVFRATKLISLNHHSAKCGKVTHSFKDLQQGTKSSSLGSVITTVQIDSDLVVFVDKLTDLEFSTAEISPAVERVLIEDGLWIDNIERFGMVVSSGPRGMLAISGDDRIVVVDLEGEDESDDDCDDA